MDSNYIAINRKAWNNKTDIHLNSEFYFLEDFKEGKSSLNSIEINLLGDVKQKSICNALKTNNSVREVKESFCAQAAFGQENESIELKQTTTNLRLF